MSLIKHYPILQRGMINKETANKLREIGRDSFDSSNCEKMKKSPKSNSDPDKQSNNQPEK